MGAEYRVQWKRKGQSRKRKIYQTRGGAEEFMKDGLRDLEEAANEDGEGRPLYPDAQWERMAAPFVEGPTLQEREVGDWHNVEGAPDPAAMSTSDGLGS